MMASKLIVGDRLYVKGKHRILFGEVISAPVFDNVSTVGPPIYFWEVELRIDGSTSSKRKIVAGKSGAIKFIVERNGIDVYSPSFKQDIRDQ